MYAIAIIRYRRPLEDVLPHVDQHRAYLATLASAGKLLASGPLDPRHGGALLLRVPEDGALEALDAIRDGDPFIRAKVAQYEILPWRPTIGVDKLDAM